MADGADDLTWEASGEQRRARYVSARGGKQPVRAVLADDFLTADAAYQLVSQGTAIVWAGDYHNARQLLTALARRIDKRRPKAAAVEPVVAFNAYRQEQAQRAALLGLLLVPLEDGKVPLKRAPDMAQALADSLGEIEEPAVIPLRDLLAFVSAHEWRKNGVPIAALGGARIHPHYGVFPPTRQDYIELVAKAPLPATDLAFDLGVGTGVLGAVLLYRGVPRVVATDIEPSALACAAENFERLGLADRVSLVEATLYPPGRAKLIVCNPPWLPGKAGTAMEGAVYDPASAMLRGFLDRLDGHLSPGGEGWLILSDLAEHLGLRSREQLMGWIAAAGLVVLGRLDTTPSPKSSRDASDPLHFARSRETVSLWRLGTSP